jgi:hypothetical protein
MNPQTTILVLLVYHTNFTCHFIYNLVSLILKNEQHLNGDWTIIAVGILLQTADYFILKALQNPDVINTFICNKTRINNIIATVGWWSYCRKNKLKKN